MTERRSVDPAMVLAIQEAVKKAFDEHSHWCLMGFTKEDKTGMTDLKVLIRDYPPAKLRESFQLMKIIVKMRNIAGTVFVVIIFGTLLVLGLDRLWPGVPWGK